MKFVSQKDRFAERGAALVTSILALLLVTLLGVTLLSIGLAGMNISSNDRQQTEAFYISEAGLTHATNLVTSVGSSQFTSILRAGDLVANTGDELSTQPSARTPIPQAGVTFGRGRYTVRISDDMADTDGNDTAAERNTDTNGRLVITSTGIGRDGATATTEAIIGVSSGPAILVNGNLRINGNPEINGSNGMIHANGILDLDGSPCASQYFSASNIIIDPLQSQGGVGCGGAGITRQNQPVIPTPLYNIRTDFYSDSDYILGAIGSQAGKVYNGLTGALIHDATTTANFWAVGLSLWRWDSGSMTWTHAGNALTDGTYYSEGNMDIGGGFGTAFAPVAATLIAEGYIKISGNPYMRPDYQPYSLIAGTDLQISGNAGAGTNNYEGINYAHHQIRFSGNPRINGVVIGANQADTGSPNSSGITSGLNLVPLEQGGYTSISGNVKITYSGGLINAGVSLISWREVRY